MYFSTFSQNPNFKKYKLDILNKAWFQDIIANFDEITGLSKEEREFCKTQLQNEIEELKSIKSINPIRTGSGRLISKEAQSLVHSNENEEPKFSQIFNSEARDEFRNLQIPFERIIKLTDTLHFDLAKLLFDKDSNTWKVLFKLYDGKKIESVLMRFEDGRNSVCVSSQVGCPVGCVFCASGQMGFMRNLTSQEIIDQVLFWARLIKLLPNDDIDKDFSKIEHKDDFERVTNVVYMGMGEPMLNYENVVDSLKVLTNPGEFGLGDRHITISSSGYIPQLEKYMQEGLKTKLAISLHAPNQELREKLMPVAKIYSLDKLMEFIKKYEIYTNKRISYEYTLIDGVNDTQECAKDLVKLLKNREAHVNLIPMNPINPLDYVVSPLSRGLEKLQKAKLENIYAFYETLKHFKIPTTIRITMGDKIQAACGQLANHNS